MQDGIEREVGALLAAGMPSAPEVAKLREPVAVELMKALYSRAGGSQPALSRAHLGAMLDLVRGGRGGRGVDLPRGLRFRIVGTYMEVMAPATGSARPPLDIKSCAGCDDANAAHPRPGLHLHLGFRPPALRIPPAGRMGSPPRQAILCRARLPRAAP